MNELKEPHFGEILRNLRIKAGFGLREFALKIGMKPSNLSFIENGRTRPPQKAEILENIAEALSLQENSEDWTLFFNSAARPGEIPVDLRKNDNVQEYLPLLCRSIVSAKLTKEQIERLVDKARNFKPGDEL